MAVFPRAERPCGACHLPSLVSCCALVDFRGSFSRRSGRFNRSSAPVVLSLVARRELRWPPGCFRVRDWVVLLLRGGSRASRLWVIARCLEKRRGCCVCSPWPPRWQIGNQRRVWPWADGSFAWTNSSGFPGFTPLGGVSEIHGRGHGFGAVGFFRVRG